MNRVNEEINTLWAREHGFTGKGVCVAVVDTGIFLHKDIKSNRIVEFKDFVKKRKFMYDDCGHGTHVAGIIGGSGVASLGRYTGIAPEADFLVIKALDNNGNGRLSVVLESLQWLINNGKKYNVRVVNISIGSSLKPENEEQSKLLKIVDRLWDEGFVVCAAAGNNGPGEMSVAAPGVSPKVITVGFVSDTNHYSGRGPTKSCIVKPEVVAPGVNIISCNNTKTGYIAKSGTSMATPIVSGAVALLLSKYPKLSNKDVKIRIFERAKDLGLPRNIQGWGSMDLKRFLRD